jgi:hypothetical protein
MDSLPELEITISTANQVTLRFSDPGSGALPHDYSGPWTRPAGLSHPEDDPEAHGRALRDALVHDPAVSAEFTRALTLTVRATPPRPLRVYLRLPSELHELSWETLLNPDDDRPLLERSQIYFFRFLQGAEPIVTSAARPRALVFIANPQRLETEAVSSGGVRLHKVEVEKERDRARRSLSPLVPTEITSVAGQKGMASLDNLMSALRDAPDPYHVLYLVCHGAVYSDGAKLWLDELDDKPVDAQLLVNGLRDLVDPERRPRLVVLASCQSAGLPGTEALATIDRRAIAAIGPKLVQEAGVGAVAAMQGNIFMRSVEVMMPAFFQELVRSGQVERAMAVARGRLRIQVDPLVRGQWRVPVLFSRLKDGQIWPAGQIRPRTVYLSRAIQREDDEWPALSAVRRALEDGGFDVVESAPAQAAAPALWSQRLLAGLGTCDAAVLLLNQRALADAGGETQIEARILCWRHWLEPDFRLIPLCLDANCQPTLQQAPWKLLCQAGAAELAWSTADDLDEQLRTHLRPLQDLAQQTRWRLSDLQQRVVQHFQEMELDDVLQQTAQGLQAEYSLPLLHEAAAVWWAQAVLSRGPVELLRLYSSLGNLTSPRVKQAFRGLLGPVGPAWVDIAAAAQIVHLAAHADQEPGSFYLKGIEPFDWVAYSYVARACGLAYDTFMENPCLLVAAPAAAATDSERIGQIRTTLRQRLEGTEPTLWAEAWSLAGGGALDDAAAWFFEPAQPAAGDDQRIDEAIRHCVESRASKQRPVLLVLSGATAGRQQLLAEVRQRFGPVIFFYMGKDPAPALGNHGASLTADLPIETAGRAYQEWKKLSGYVSS